MFFWSIWEMSHFPSWSPRKRAYRSFMSQSRHAGLPSPLKLATFSSLRAIICRQVHNWPRSNCETRWSQYESQLVYLGRIKHQVQVCSCGALSASPMDRRGRVLRVWSCKQELEACKWQPSAFTSLWALLVNLLYQEISNTSHPSYIQLLIPKRKQGACTKYGRGRVCTQIAE